MIHLCINRLISINNYFIAFCMILKSFFFRILSKAMLKSVFYDVTKLSIHEKNYLYRGFVTTALAH